MTPLKTQIVALLRALRRFETELEMAAIEFDLDALFVEMTEDEAREIFPTVSRRSPQFPAFQLKVNSLKVGSEWHINLPPGAEPVKAARELRYNVNEAAKERKVWKTATLNEDEAAQYAANKKIDRFERVVTDEDGEPQTVHITRMKDGWKQEVTEPITLRWHTDTRDEEREFTDKDGKVGRRIEKIPTKLHVLVLATEAIRHRASRANGANGTNGNTPDPAPAPEPEPTPEPAPEPAPEPMPEPAAV